jgi:hypothetical protein
MTSLEHSTTTKPSMLEWECLTNFNQQKSRVSMSLALKWHWTLKFPLSSDTCGAVIKKEITLDESNIRVASIATNCQLPYQRALEPASTRTLNSNTELSALYITNALLLTYWERNQKLASFSILSQSEELMRWEREKQMIPQPQHCLVIIQLQFPHTWTTNILH